MYQYRIFKLDKKTFVWATCASNDQECVNQMVEAGLNPLLYWWERTRIQ